jgi:hypothetical protein
VQVHGRGEGVGGVRRGGGEPGRLEVGVALARVVAVLVEEAVEAVDDDLAVDEVGEVHGVAARLAATRELPPMVDGAELHRVDEKGVVHLDAQLGLPGRHRPDLA